LVLLIAQLSRERDLSGAPSPDTPAAQSNVEPQEQNALGVRFLHLPPDTDQSRFAQEQLPPITYLSASYYQRWLLGMEKNIVERGATAEELKAGHATGAGKTLRRKLTVSLNDWWRWVIDFGAPGPDRGQGGKYLILPPDYDGPLPQGGYFVARSRTIRVLILGRMFLVNNDPNPAAELIKSRTKIYPYVPGGEGTSIAEFLSGDAKLGRITEPPPTVFREGSGVVMNTIPPNDFSFYESLNEVVQQEPATTLDPELMGPLAAIGIIKGKPFAPDARMKKILTEALTLANATSRSLLVEAA